MGWGRDLFSRDPHPGGESGLLQCRRIDVRGDQHTVDGVDDSVGRFDVRLHHSDVVDLDAILVVMVRSWPSTVGTLPGWMSVDRTSPLTTW